MIKRIAVSALVLALASLVLACGASGPSNPAGPTPPPSGGGVQWAVVTGIKIQPMPVDSATRPEFIGQIDRKQTGISYTSQMILKQGDQVFANSTVFEGVTSNTGASEVSWRVQVTLPPGDYRIVFRYNQSLNGEIKEYEDGRDFTVVQK